ncbi:MAG: hypothetical protein HY974_01385 [Candidatus Kerfeldbacteria bacterium]|nr:hypothetical protein [Candidatus Kerfeldbacteria bacterium]
MGLARLTGAGIGQELLRLLSLPEDQQPAIAVRTTTDLVYSPFVLLPKESVVLSEGRVIAVVARRFSERGLEQFVWVAEGTPVPPGKKVISELLVTKAPA